jgi:homoserine O-acetyltransferase/O-succinyltransferase
MPMESVMSLSAAPATLEAACDAPGAAHHDAVAHALPTRGVCPVVLGLRHAGERRVRIAWECVGPAGAPLLVVQGGISATRHVAANTAHPEAGWWDAQAGAGGALDSRRWRLLSIDWLGADGALDVALDPADQADAIAAVLDVLGLDRVHAFVGASYGAMVGLQFAARHAARLGRLVAISGAHRAHPQATALRVVQRRIVRLGRSEAGCADALALARALAVVGYRSSDEFDARFDAAPQVDGHGARFAVEDYFDALGPRFVARFTPTAYLRLSESIDLQRLDPASVRVATDVVAVEQDQVVPLADLRALAAGLGAPARLHTLSSRYGHDAFLKETATIDAILRRALQPGVAA